MANGLLTGQFFTLPTHTIRAKNGLRRAAIQCHPHSCGSHRLEGTSSNPKKNSQLNRISPSAIEATTWIADLIEGTELIHHQP